MSDVDFDDYEDLDEPQNAGDFMENQPDKKDVSKLEVKRRLEELLEQKRQRAELFEDSDYF